MAVGYAAGAVLTLICLIVSATARLPDTMFYAICIAFAGVWWLAFGCLAFAKMLARPGPPVPLRPAAATAPRCGGLPLGLLPLGLQPLGPTGWAGISATVATLRRYPHTLRFLLLHFVFSDGYATVILVGILFAQNYLCMSGQVRRGAVACTYCRGGEGGIRSSSASSLPKTTCA